MNHLIKKTSITKSLLVYLICPLAHDSASPCSFTIQQGLQVSLHKNAQQIYFGSGNHIKNKDFWRETSDERAHSDNRAGSSRCIESSRPLYLWKRAGSRTSSQNLPCLFTWGTKRGLQIYGDHSAEVRQLRINPPILLRVERRWESDALWSALSFPFPDTGLLNLK